MGFSFTGQVLRSAQVATGNAVTTGESDTGVVRDIRPVPGVYSLAAPDFVDAAADQYRAAIVEAAGTTPNEYLVWAANTADLAGPKEDDPSWWTEDGFGIIPTDIWDAGAFTDASLKAIVHDNGNRNLGRIFSVVVARGDVTDYEDEGWKNPDDTNPASYIDLQPRKGVKPYLTLYFTEDQQDPRLGVGYLNASQQASLDGGLSNLRGDKILSVHYTVGTVRFWWTRNDRFETRFSWNGPNRRWEPNKGSAPKNLGVLGDSGVFQMDPAVRNLPIGAFLPGASSTYDTYAMIRSGLRPDTLGSIPVGNIQVKADSDIDNFDFGLAPNLNGVVGQSNGKLKFNQTFIDQHGGNTIWYAYKGFQASSDGIVGKMTDQYLFVAPVPSLTDFPLLRFGNRSYLQATVTASDADLITSPEPQTGEVIVSAATGLLRFAKADLAKADPNNPAFSKYFLGEDVIYDGVSLSGKPQATRAPVQLLDQNGDPAVATSSELYIPTFQYLPVEFGFSDSRRGLGVSGVLDAPDGTGAVPAGGANASVRPGGDNTGDTTTGRIRQVVDGISDTFVFSQMGSVGTFVVVDYERDLPDSGDIPSGTAYAARELGAHGSKVVLSSDDKVKFGDRAVFFLQAAFTPATYSNKPKILSRNRDIFRFSGVEVLRFAIDGVGHTWLAATLVAAYPNKTFFTPEEVADSINQITNKASVLDGHVVLSSDNPMGSVEIGFGVGTEKDLSGATSLGFLPGWRVVGGVDNWLPDSGVTMGLSRSPLKVEGDTTVPDFKATDRVQDLVLSGSLSSIPFQFLDTVPLQDVVGFDEGIFFNLQTAVTNGDSFSIVNRFLNHYTDVIYRFGQRKFDWVSEHFVTNQVQTATMTLNLGASGIAPESLHSAVGGDLSVSPDGKAFVKYQQGEDYLLPQKGNTGTALLVHQYGKTLAVGSKGVVSSGSALFTDAEADFSGAKVGDYLLIGKDGSELYAVTGFVDKTTITISPTPVWSSSLPERWSLFEGYPDSVYDPTIVADMSYVDFNFLPQESMVIRVLTPLGNFKVGKTSNLPLAKAKANGRVLSLRFGLAPATAATEATLKALQQILLGSLGGTLVVPDTESLRFNHYRFSIKMGTQLFTHNTGLYGVFSFSNDPERIEYLTQDLGDTPKGSLNFGSAIRTAFTQSEVYYVEEMLDDSDIPLGQALYDPNTGDFKVSQADYPVLQDGAEIYLVEQLITDQRLDVAINPLLGAFSTNAPLSIGSSVEVSYWQADVEGRKIGKQITEFLPVFVRDEAAVRTIRNTYTFNTNRKHTVDQSIEPIVYIGPMLQNFGRVDYIVDYPVELSGQGRLTFVSHVVPDNVVVKVSYGIFDMLGGERSFEVSTKPVYRPPFFIKAGQDRFGLRGDRVAEFTAGQMLRIGGECFYIKSLKYYAQNAAGTGDVTSVSIFPPTTHEVGSRSPGNDVLTVITADPITTVVDPDGPSPVVTGAPTGFMSALDLTLFPFEPISRGQTVVVFQGDLTQFAVAGHILEVGGCPYTIASSQLSADGSSTSITVTSGFWKGFSTFDKPTVKLSYRPVYPPEATDFIGCGPFLDTEVFEAALFERSKPGHLLSRDVDYSVDSGTGIFKLKKGLNPGDKLILRFTHLTMLQPFMQDGIVVNPKFQAAYLALAAPSEANGLLGGTLTGNYAYRSPDAFYFRAIRLASFLGEVVQEVVQEITNKQPASGALTFSHEGLKNWQQGRFGLKGERRNLLDKDRAARTFLDFYNNVVVGFEQIEETISGGFIGDRDGKFRFWVGHGKDIPTPGYEDAITGYLTTRNVWSDVVNSANATAKYFSLPTDWVVTPDTIHVVNGEVLGDLPHSAFLDALTKRQKTILGNDVDDVLLVGIGSTETALTITPPFFDLKAKAGLQPMWQTHQLSRLFPTTTTAFVRTMPGVGYNPATGDVGVYTAGREINGEQVSTNGNTIAQLQNPVVGPIHNVNAANLHKRKARARIWGYFPTGIPADSLGAGIPVADITYPCVLAVPVLLRDIPIRPDTGYPDCAQFLSQGGTIPDATSGDPLLVVPGFAAGDKIVWGKPDGTQYPAFNGGDPKVVNGKHTYTGLYVREVLYGCLISLQDVYGAAILNPAVVWAGTNPADQLPITQGDTIFIGSPTDAYTTVPTELPELSTFKEFTASMDLYREGADVKITEDGQLIDITMPSGSDGSLFSLQELFGQNPPTPLASLEGVVRFFYDAQNPLQIPALRGKTQNDSGDYSIPYLSSSNTEMDRFSQASAGLSLVLSTIDPSNHAVYPNEIVGTDGNVVTTSGSEPATLTTSLNTSPGFGPGEGDVRPYDLLLMQTGTNPFSVSGAQGIHTVGSVVAGSPSLIEPPRFITSTKPPVLGATNTGDPIQYLVQNAMVFVQGPYPDQPQLEPSPPPGVQISQNAGTTTLDFSSTSIHLNNGVTVGVGNLNDVLAAHPLNTVTIQLIARKDIDILNGLGGVLPSSGAGGVVALTITINSAGWTLLDYQGGSVLAGGATTFGVGTDGRQIQLNFAAAINWGPGPGTRAQWYLPHTFDGTTYSMLYGFEYSISVDTTAGESHTAWISDDRLTFNEVFDLSFAKERGFTHPQSAISLETGLAVYSVTVGQTASTTVISTINTYINGLSGGLPIPLTFVPRTNSGLVGSWVPRNVNPALDTERGSIKAMGFEGHSDVAGNLTITGSAATFSAVPSNNLCPSGFIFSGRGKTASHYNTNLGVVERQGYDNRVAEITTVSGDSLRVEAGDVLVIPSSANSNHPATHQAGTYLVRHAVESTGLNPYLKAAPSTTAGAESGWCPVHFPKTVSFDPTLEVLVITDLAPAAGGPAAGTCGFATPVAGVPGVGTRIYIIRNVGDLASPDINVYKNAVVSANYTGQLGTSFQLTDYRDATGILGSLDATSFKALLDTGGPYQVSGMAFWPVNVSGVGLPDNNCVGFDSASTGAIPGVDWAVYGFRRVALVPPTVLSAAATVEFWGDSPSPSTYQIKKSTGSAQTIVPVLGSKVTAYEYHNNPKPILYDWVTQGLDVREVDHTQWEDLNIPPLSAGVGSSLVDCLLPGTGLNLGTDVSPGFYAQSGVFLEPSFPRSAMSLSLGYPNVVDAGNSFPNTTGLDDWDRSVGMRNAKEYAVSGATNVPDEVYFEIRRIRRFHEVTTVADQNLAPLRFAYEIRRGRITNYTLNNKQNGVLVANNYTMDWESTKPVGAPKAPDVWNDGLSYTGTNLGGFANTDVNIKAGDMLRLLDASGNVQEEVQIASIQNSGVLLLAAPGLLSETAVDLVGMRFEVFLKQAPVPHEQSCEELLALMTDKVVTKTDVDWTAQTGGYVPDLLGGTTAYDTVVNKLYDDQKAPGSGQSFGVLGVKKGDIVIVDPAGIIPKSGGVPTIQEHGTRPIGDEGVPTRVVAGVYVAGTPSSLDDNRGFYRVKKVVDSANPPYVEVDPINTYAGKADTPVLFGSASEAYSVYPTVTDSVLKKSPYPVGDGKEGQMDLRPTRLRTSFKEEFLNPGDGYLGHSIRPFSYHIIRPSKLFSDQAVDLILMMRERMLSLIELFRRGMLNTKSGSYYVFQRDQHLLELGNQTDPDLGLGVPSNLYIEAIGGRMGIVPYANNSACLSLLDRRMWVHDTRLDSLTTNGFGGMRMTGLGDTAYTAYTDTIGTGSSVLPVLPERIEGVLESKDKFRPVRYVWLAYRTHKILGTLAAIAQYDKDLPDRLTEQKKLLVLEDSTKAITE